VSLIYFSSKRVVDFNVIYRFRLLIL